MVRNLLKLAACLAALLTQSLATGDDAAPRLPYIHTGDGERILTYNETTPGAKIRPETLSVRWLTGGSDGEYISKVNNGDLVRTNIATGKSDVFLAAAKIPKQMREYSIGPGLKKTLFSTNATNQFRYSYFANYFIYDSESDKLEPLVKDQVGDILYAELSPAGDYVAFVRENDLYLRDSQGKITRITNDGSPEVFNGVPDYVYQEEITEARSALWFSPDGKYISYLTFNETEVETYTVPMYMDNQKYAPQYPKELKLRYPKPGTPIPHVRLNVLNIETKNSKAIDITGFDFGIESVIGEVAWVTEDHANFVYRVFNRVQDQEKHVVVDAETRALKTIRSRDATDGWLENAKTIRYVGQIDANNKESYFVDISDESGWMHLYLHPVHGGKPIQLTSGEWEVRSILKVDRKRKLVYFAATKHHSTESHVYSVSYATSKLTALVDDTVDAMWSASFSSDGGYYILSYRGPHVPYQELYSVDKKAPIKTLVDNAKFAKQINEYNLPNVTFFELHHPDGFTLNVKQTLPPDFDPSEKYPVLFNPYGGPNSQQVNKAFTPLNWAFYIASEPKLNYISYVIDNRGTGFKGRKFRSPVTKQLGKLEALDQIWAARELASRFPFINANKIGMWGWSYGGFLTSKMIEQDSGVFSFGLITAPVSDFRLYDCMYTERYMKTPQMNEAGYNETAVRKVAGFKNIAGGFAIMHGTGDDNVHVQHSTALVDLLVGEGVSPQQMKVMLFTDSNHGIYYNGASDYLYKFLSARLWDEVQREGKKMIHQWSRRDEEKAMVN